MIGYGLGMTWFGIEVRSRYVGLPPHIHVRIVCVCHVMFPWSWEHAFSVHVVVYLQFGSNHRVAVDIMFFFPFLQLLGPVG